ncbi:hypothetical protein J7W08_09675 [Methanococcoides orientis]|uniref:hypothetical protein n=1 Tax=Methanococcoides orientis TaxID=2822137 RepID=UPI001E4C901B|nr:hypothetical protein [Methanococcoides orientis]UGV40342.1 hypothetical protein J7W08_09675 [Methanococcoides orientis]
MTDRNQVLNINMLGCPSSSTCTGCGKTKMKAKKRGNSTRDGMCSRGNDGTLVETKRKKI